MRNIVKTGGTRPDTEITREKLVFQIARWGGGGGGGGGRDE